jgi:hypothetical protein
MSGSVTGSAFPRDGNRGLARAFARFQSEPSRNPKLTRATCRQSPSAFECRCLALRQIGTIAHNVNGADFAIAYPRFVIADGRAAGAAMDRFIDQIVRRSIRHAQLMLRQGSYNWPVARLALRKILSDLEARAPEDPSVLRLRAFIASKDREWLREKR